MSPTVPPTVEWVALAASAGVLVVASVSDLKSREVSNRVWMLYGPVALLLFIMRIILSFGDAPVLLVSALSTIAVAFLLFQFGMMGGADSKALMCLGLALPVPPGIVSALWQAPFPLYPYPIAILANSLLLSIGSGVVVLARNLVRGTNFRGLERESVLTKLMALFTSYKTSFTILQSSTHLYPAERVDLVESKPIRHFRLFSSAEEEREKLVAGLENYKAQGLFADGVWVTPGLPHLVFLTASLATILVIGDLLMLAFFRIVGYS